MFDSVINTPLQQICKTKTVAAEHIANKECLGEAIANSIEYSRKKIIPAHIQDLS